MCKELNLQKQKEKEKQHIVHKTEQQQNSFRSPLMEDVLGWGNLTEEEGVWRRKELPTELETEREKVRIAEQDQKIIQEAREAQQQREDALEQQLPQDAVYPHMMRRQAYRKSNTMPAEQIRSLQNKTLSVSLQKLFQAQRALKQEQLKGSVEEWAEEVQCRIEELQKKKWNERTGEDRSELLLLLEEKNRLQDVALLYRKYKGLDRNAVQAVPEELPVLEKLQDPIRQKTEYQDQLKPLDAQIEAEKMVLDQFACTKEKFWIWSSADILLEIQKWKEVVQSNEKQIADMQQELNKFGLWKTKKAEIQRAIENMQNNIKEIEAKISTLEDQRQANLVRERINNLNLQRKDLQQKLNEVQQQLEASAKQSSYALEQWDPETLQKHLDMIKIKMVEDQEAAKLQQLKENVRIAQAALDTETEALLTQKRQGLRVLQKKDLQERMQRQEGKEERLKHLAQKLEERKQQEAARQAEEQRRQAELEEQQKAEEQRRQAELEEQQKAEEQRRQAELEEQQKAEERRAEQQRRQAELEEQRRAEEQQLQEELQQTRMNWQKKDLLEEIKPDFRILSENEKNNLGKIKRAMYEKKEKKWLARMQKQDEIVAQVYQQMRKVGKNHTYDHDRYWTASGEIQPYVYESHEEGNQGYFRNMGLEHLKLQTELHRLHGNKQNIIDENTWLTKEKQMVLQNMTELNTCLRMHNGNPKQMTEKAAKNALSSKVMKAASKTAKDGQLVKTLARMAVETYLPKEELAKIYPGYERGYSLPNEEFTDPGYCRGMFRGQQNQDSDKVKVVILLEKGTHATPIFAGDAQGGAADAQAEGMLLLPGTTYRVVEFENAGGNQILYLQTVPKHLSGK